MATYCSITVTADTAARFRAASLDLCRDAGRVLTRSEQVDYLLDTWMTHREEASYELTQP